MYLLGGDRWFSLPAMLSISVHSAEGSIKELTPGSGWWLCVRLHLKWMNLRGPSGEGRPRDDGDVMRPGSSGTPSFLCAFRLYTRSQPQDTCQNRARE
jgi:hypothetical protein